uniref:Sin3a_C domain-containing protein n=1 Tax=Strongyloides stercoralis TaxID=6248 RepID=A0A0K0DSK1_STRER
MSEETNTTDDGWNIDKTMNTKVTRKRKLLSSKHLVTGENNGSQNEIDNGKDEEPIEKIHKSAVLKMPTKLSGDSTCYLDMHKRYFYDNEYFMDVDKPLEYDSEIYLTEYEGDADSEDILSKYSISKKRFRKTAYMVDYEARSHKNIPDVPRSFTEVRQASYQKRLIYFLQFDEDDVLVLPRDAKPALTKILTNNMAKRQLNVKISDNHYVITRTEYCKPISS